MHIVGVINVVVTILVLRNINVRYLDYETACTNYKQIQFLSLNKILYLSIFYSHEVALNLMTHYLENKRRQFWFCCHRLSGNGQARPYLE